MFRSWIRLGLAGLLITLSLPLLAVSLLIASLSTAVIVVVPKLRKRWRTVRSDLRNQWTANEFQFERAIKEYEDLIDVHAWRRP